MSRARGSQAPGHSHGPREKRRPVETKGLRGALVTLSFTQKLTGATQKPSVLRQKSAFGMGGC